MDRWRAVDKVSPAERLGWYANWRGSNVGGRMEVMCSFISLSKRFIIVGVRAAGC